ncbi:MAG: carbohydrate ABC transporter permease [Anaerolineaceae bacterium]|nr:MAG: carbohydrate ABC transporter permease [Anaerolineaceae bacterium]
MNKHQGKAAGFIKAFLWIYCSFIVFILGYITYNSLRPKSQILSNTFGKPTGLSFDNYKKLIIDDKFFRYFGNSAIILIASLVLLILLSSLTAYGIARYKFKMKKFVRIFFLIGLMFPVQLGIVPIFLIMSKLGLINNMASVILISGTNVSMPVFMLSNFFAGLPKEMQEAAQIDGAGEWTIFQKIMMPLAKPVVMAVCITVSVQIWNQFFIPLIFIQSDKLKTIPLLVTKYTNNLMSSINLALAISVLSTIPILIIFIFFSNKIIDGVMAGAVKG